MALIAWLPQYVFWGANARSEHYYQPPIYLKTFDDYEKKVIQASRHLNEDISTGYLDEVSPKGVSIPKGKKR